MFPILVKEFSAIVTIIDTIAALQRPQQNDPARLGAKVNRAFRVKVTRITPQLSSNSSDTFDAPVLTVCSSDVESQERVH